jgi:DNA-binding response OmpR family regulator
VASLDGYANRDRHPLPDVICWLNLPRVNGFEFLEWLRSPSCPHRLIPVVVMSSYDSQRVTAYKLGADSYLIKPVNWRNSGTHQDGGRVGGTCKVSQIDSPEY